MKDWIEQFDLNYTCTIKKPVYVNDSYCNITTQYTTIASNKKCAVWQSRGNEIVIGDRIHNPIYYTMAIEPDTNYTPECIVIVKGSTFRMGNAHDVANENAIIIIDLESKE